MQNPQKEASSTKREHGLVEWLRPSLLRGVWSSFTPSPSADRLSTQYSHTTDKLRGGNEKGWVVVHPQAARTANVQAGLNEPIGDEVGTLEVDGWELVKLPVQGNRMTVPGNDSMPGKMTPRQEMPLAWTRDYTDTIQRALGGITIDRQVDISSALRWAFRSQTTYEVHPHVYRFPTTPTAVSSPPTLTEAEPVSTTPAAKASSQALCDASVLLEDDRLEGSSLEDSSLSDASAEDSSMEGSSLEDCSVEDAALEDASHERWSGLVVQARVKPLEGCGVDTQPPVRAPRRISSALEEGASAPPLRAAAGPPPPEGSEVSADGGDRGQPEAAAAAPRRSIAWAAGVRSRSMSTSSSAGPAGHADVAPDTSPPGQPANNAAGGPSVAVAPTLGTAEEEILRQLIASTLPCARGPAAAAVASAATPSAFRTPARPSGRATCETYATARSTFGSVASASFPRATRETFVTAEAASPRSTSETFVSEAGTLSSWRRSGTAESVIAAPGLARKPRRSRGRRSTAWSLDSAATRGTTRCTLFSRGRRSSAWTLDGLPDADEATREWWTERSWEEHSWAEWEEWQRDRAGSRSQADEWWREEEKAEGRKEESKGRLEVAAYVCAGDQGAHERVHEDEDAAAALCADDALPRHVRGHSEGAADGRVRWVHNSPSWVATCRRQPTRRTSECSMFSTRPSRETCASAWELHWPPQRVTSWLEEGPPDWSAEDAAAAARGGDWGLHDSLRWRKERVSGTAALGSLRRRMAADDVVAIA